MIRAFHYWVCLFLEYRYMWFQWVAELNLVQHPKGFRPHLLFVLESICILDVSIKCEPIFTSYPFHALMSQSEPKLQGDLIPSYSLPLPTVCMWQTQFQI